jgi:hypothetical protein
MAGSRATAFSSAVHGHVEEVLAQLRVVGEAAGGEHHRLGRPHPDGGAVGAGGLDPDHPAAVVADDPLHPVAGADLDPVALGGRAQGADGHRAPVRHGVAGVLRHQHPAGRGLVLGQLAPVVGHRGAVPVGEGAALGQQLGGGRGAVVDGLAHGVLPLGQAEAGGLRVVALRPGQPGHVAQAVLLGVLQAEVAHRLVVGHPVPEGGLGGGPAQLRRLLQHQHAVAQPAGEQRRGQAGATSADDHDVVGRVEAGGAGGGSRRFARGCGRGRRRHCRSPSWPEMQRCKQYLPPEAGWGRGGGQAARRGLRAASSSGWWPESQLAPRPRPTRHRSRP